MQPDTAPLVLPEGSAREQLEDFLDAALLSPKVKRHILALADCHAAQVVEMCLRPYPVPGGARVS